MYPGNCASLSGAHPVLGRIINPTGRPTQTNEQSTKKVQTLIWIFHSRHPQMYDNKSLMKHNTIHTMILSAKLKTPDWAHLGKTCSGLAPSPQVQIVVVMYVFIFITSLPPLVWVCLCVFSTGLTVWALVGPCSSTLPGTQQATQVQTRKLHPWWLLAQLSTIVAWRASST